MSENTGYLHGFSPTEQNRLYHQAEMLKEALHRDLDFQKGARVLEMGCGVGAQTKILLEKFPDIYITAVDFSDVQLERAQEYLKPFIRSGRCVVQKEDATSLSFSSDSFDGVYICWILEHIPERQKVVQEAFRVLKSQGPVFINEVQNNTFFVDPYSPAIIQYWYEFNDHQWNLGGDPFVGAKLGNFLNDSGFKEIQVLTRTEHYDNRSPQRRSQQIDFWSDLMMSGADELLKTHKVTPHLVQKMKEEFEVLKNTPDSVFYYNFCFACGNKP